MASLQSSGFGVPNLTLSQKTEPAPREGAWRAPPEHVQSRNIYSKATL